jgi:hypothetical protein
LISNVSYIKSVKERNPSTWEVYKRTPKGIKEDKENKKIGKSPRNPKPTRTEHLPNRPIKTHHPTQQLPNPALPLKSCAFSSLRNPTPTRTQQLPN